MHVQAQGEGGEEALALEGPDDEEPLDSLSLGYADGGRLEHPFALHDSEVLHAARSNRYGTRELVGLLERAASAVDRAAPGSRLVVGNLSAEQGGHLFPHESHQSGRDADVGFYALAEDGTPRPQAIMQRVAPDGGMRRGEQSFRFDDARNWELVVAFVDDPMAETQYVIVAPHIRERLLAYARDSGADADQIRRVELVTVPMRGSESHDDHFHVRIYCSVGDRPQCLDRPPLHPWYYGTPSPDAVAAARAADVLRAAALRRRQQEARQAELALQQGRVNEARREADRARVLRADGTRQLQAERVRAMRLSQDERRALRELQRQEKEIQREAMAAESGERGRAAALEGDSRRWFQSERRRAERLRAALRRQQADDRRRATRQKAQARRDTQRAEAQRRAERRRAEALMKKGERILRESQKAAQRRMNSP
ncbi:MAG: penicillin-insensitive murein endopeptidase [Myxococcales bacterium]|nr:penicillin-insensitive murein endopeptidase [Myxococcales bacterium]